jgi:hypothetical protein
MMRSTVALFLHAQLIAFLSGANFVLATRPRRSESTMLLLNLNMEERLASTSMDMRRLFLAVVQTASAQARSVIVIALEAGPIGSIATKPAALAQRNAPTSSTPTTEVTDRSARKKMAAKTSELATTSHAQLIARVIINPLASVVKQMSRSQHTRSPSQPSMEARLAKRLMAT